MYKNAPCYSAMDYYGYFDLDISDKKVLDIGSSVGSFKKSKKFNKSLSSLKDTRQYITLDIDPTSGADIIGDAHRLRFKDNEFDIILANNVIEHLYDPKKAVSEMGRVLKKGGKIYFTIPFLYPVHEAPHDYNRFTKFGLLKLLESFKNVEVYSRGGIFSTGANLLYKMSHVLDGVKLGALARFIMYPVLWLTVQLDRFDKTEAFARAYFGSAQK